MVLVEPKAFILNSLLKNKLLDSLFIINSFIMDVISINVKKYQTIPQMGAWTAMMVLFMFLFSIIDKQPLLPDFSLTFLIT